MRKLSVLLLTILLLNLCLGAYAGAEGNLAAPFASGSGEAAMASRIAEILETDTIPADDALPESERRINAANLMLADPGTLLCDTGLYRGRFQIRHDARMPGGPLPALPGYGEKHGRGNGNRRSGELPGLARGARI